MKLKYRLLSLATSLALVFGSNTNALAAPVTKSAKAAAAIPEIKLSATNENVQVGDELTVSVSVDGSANGFAVLIVGLDFEPASFNATKVESIAAKDAQDYNVTPIRKDAQSTINPTGYTKLGLDSIDNIKANLGTVATYTFTAVKAGKYDFTVSGQVSAVDESTGETGAATTITKSSKLTVTVGAKTLTADAKNHPALTGTYGDSWEALAKQIDRSKVQLSESVKGTWAYAGTAARPTVADKSADFIFTPEDAATYSTATASFTLNIAPKELKPVLNLSNKMYDGSNAVTEGQNASVSLKGVLDKDNVSAEYKEISYDSESAGKHTVTASGITLQGEASGNYILSANSCQTESSITPYTGKVTVQENIASRSYDGESHPLTNEELILTDDENEKKLTLDTDYTVSYSEEPIGSPENDVSITYTLSGTGNYEGCTFTEDTGSFTILKRPMPNASGSLKDASFTIGETYTPQEPGISVTGKDGETVVGSISLRYKAENSGWTADVPSQPGKYSIGAYFESNDAAYSSGMLENVTAATLTVYKILSQEDFTLGKTEFTYNGEQQQPAVSSALSAETDYTVSVPESVNANDYEIKVEGKGYYKGEVQFGYTIAKAEGSGSVTMADYTYGEATPAPVPTSTTNETAGVTYTYAGRDGTTYTTAPTNVGSYTVTAHFAETANATKCTATANFTVKPKGLVADDFTLRGTGTEFTYNGSEQKPAVLVAEGCNLAEGTGTEFTYNGEVQKPTVSVAEGRKLTKGTDYTVQYPEASTNAGSYKVTVTGQGNYTGRVELPYKIKPAVYTVPQDAIETELPEYPISIYSGQPLSHIGLKATGLPEGAQFGWKAGNTPLSADTDSYDITVNPNNPNYSEGTAKLSVKLVNAVAPAGSKDGITNQLSTFAASISKTASENGALSADALADIAQLTLSGKLTPKEQDDLKSAHLSDTKLLNALDESAKDVKVSTQLNKGDQGDKSALTDLAITTGGQAAFGKSSGEAIYTAKDITPEKPADGQLIKVELSLSNDPQAAIGQQPAVPVLVSLSFDAKNANPSGKFQVVHEHIESDASKNFTTQYECRSVSKSGDTVTVQFLAASFSSFSIQYTAPASGGSSSSSATPKPDEPQPTATPALTASETTWLGGYGALLNAKSGTALSLDVTACEYLPGYIITGVQSSGVTLNLSTPAGKLCLSPAVAKAMNGSYNYTFADALAIAGKVAAAAKPAASPAPVKDPTAASPTPAPTPVPTAAPQPTQAPAPQPEVDTPEKSHSPLPIVAAVLVAAALLAGGYLAYNSASRRKAMHDVYAPSKKVKLNQNQNNGRNRK